MTDASVTENIITAELARAETREADTAAGFGLFFVCGGIWAISGLWGR